MPRLPCLSATKIIGALRRAGFVDAPKRGKGSHRALCRTDQAGMTRLVVVPMGRDIPKGTLLAIISQSGLSRDEFLELLK